jgi:folate-dependent tRNA-U54 methylase TrmFO/GidA
LKHGHIAVKQWSLRAEAVKVKQSTRNSQYAEELACVVSLPQNNNTIGQGVLRDEVRKINKRRSLQIIKVICSLFIMCD